MSTKVKAYAIILSVMLLIIFLVYKTKPGMIPFGFFEFWTLKGEGWFTTSLPVFLWGFLANAGFLLFSEKARSKLECIGSGRLLLGGGKTHEELSNYDYASGFFRLFANGIPLILYFLLLRFLYLYNTAGAQGSPWDSGSHRLIAYLLIGIPLMELVNLTKTTNWAWFQKGKKALQPAKTR